MAADTGNRIQMWQFRHAPSALQTLFPRGGDADWLVHAPAAENDIAESLLLRWQRIYPVESRELADRSSVYWGAQTEALALLQQWGEPIADSPPVGFERRAGVRVRIECPTRYETQSEPKHAGLGHTIDISSGGIFFTTESLLPSNAEVILRVTWPVPLDGDIPVELRAVGKLARTESMKAALQMESLTFSVAS